MILAHNDTLREGVVTFHKFNKSYIDSMGNAVLNYQAGSPSFTTGKINDAIVFNGSNYIDVGDLTTYSFVQNTGVFSINFWAKVNDTTLTHYPLGNSGTTVQNGFYLGFVNGNFQFVTTNGISGQYGYNLNVPGVITDTDWHMYTLTADGTLITLYKDTVFQGNSFNIDPFATGDSFSTMQIGKIQNYGLQLYQGQMDELGFWNRELTPKEVRKLYNNNIGFQFPFNRILVQPLKIEAGLVAAYNLDNSAKDSLGKYNGTIQGDITFEPGVIGNAARFKGAPGNTLIRNLDKFDFIQSTGIFTFNVWIKPDDNGHEGGLFCNNAGTPANNGFFIDKVGVNLYVYLWADGLQSPPLLAFGIFDTLDWQMITVIGDGTQCKIYKDAVLYSTTSYDTWVPTPCTALYKCTLGGFPDTVSYKYYGLMDMAYVWNRNLSDAEVVEMYNSSNAKYLPVRKLINQQPDLKKDLQASWNLDGDVTDVLANYDGFNEVSTQYYPGLIGQCWEGGGGNIPRCNIPTVSGQTDFTMCYWIKQKLNTSAFQGIFGSFPVVSYCAYVNGQNCIQWSSGSLIQTPNNSLTLNQWHCIAITQSAGTAKIYIDGKLKAKGTGFTPVGFDTLGYFGFGSPYDIDLDLYSMWFKELTQEQVVAYYNKGNGTQYPFNI